MLDFNRFEVLTFDCYRTLINWETGILSALHRPGIGAVIAAEARPDLRVSSLAELAAAAVQNKGLG